MIYWTAASRNPEELEAASKEFLSPQERGRMEGMRFPKRRREWLLGRWTAKRLAVQTIPSLRGLALTEFSILNQAEGAPFFAHQDGRPIYAALSISHRDDWALCAVSTDETLRLGVDIERVEPREPGFIRDYFTESEQTYASHLAVASQSEWVTAAWSLKEAVLKALGTGLRVDTRRVEIRFTQSPEDFEPDPQDWSPVEIHTFDLGDYAFRACWRRQGEHVLTLAANLMDALEISFVSIEK